MVLLRQAGEGAEGLRITEEPGLRHHHRFDQCLLLAGRAAEYRPVILEGALLVGRHALANRALDDAAANRLGVQADAGLEQAFDVLDHAGASCSVAWNSRARWASSSNPLTSMRWITPRPSRCTSPR